MDATIIIKEINEIHVHGTGPAEPVGKEVEAGAPM
jgi:hypothetical protein